jgi:tetratricopeptide (TPR) repeat protein
MLLKAFLKVAVIFLDECRIAFVKLMHYLADYVAGRWLVWRGVACLEREKPDLAAVRFEKALKRAPWMFHVDFLAGEAYFYSGSHEDALRHFNFSRRKEGDNFGLFYYLGRIYQERGELECARSYLEEALRLFEKLPEAEYALGSIALALGDRDKALRHFRAYVSSDTLMFDLRLRKALEKYCGPSDSPGA